MRCRPLPVALTLLFCAACGPADNAASTKPAVAPQPPIAKTSATPVAPPPQAATFDPVAVGMTADGVTKLCDDHLRAAQSLLDQLKASKNAPPEQLTYAATLGRFDDVISEVANADDFPTLMAVAHPDAAVRDAAKACDPKADKFLTALYLDADAAAVIKAFAAKGEKMEGERAKLLSDVLRDFRRNGIDLPPEKQERLRALNAEITLVGQKFEVNIAESKGKVEVPSASTVGLPPEWIAKHPAKDGKVTVTTDYPDYFPFVTYAKDRKAALDLYVQFVNRGGDENLKLLDKLLALRNEKAKLLGYPSWAAYAIEPRMAKTPQAVRDFLARVTESVREPAKAEMAELMKEHVALGGRKTDKLPPVDRMYLEDRVRAKKYRLDSQEVSKYFEVGAVTKGLLDITARMYALEYRTVAAPAWHPDVTAYDVVSNGETIGRFYLDLAPRPDKFKHAAAFTIRTAKRLSDGTFQRPISALECNFPKPGAEPALMSHEDVVTFFHEFGHVLHQMLTRSELASLSGSRTARDFVEAPSQMFEEWPWSREVLDLFAKHYKTGERIPDDVFRAMTRARTFGRALATQRQLVFATLDLEYHSREPGFDTTKVYEEIQSSVDSFAYVKGTHFQSSFGHIVGYDAGYYGYQWALAMSRDVLTRFRKEGLLNTQTAAAWRDEVLSKGGGVDERAMVTRFLGREPNDAAYTSYLKGTD